MARPKTFHEGARYERNALRDHLSRLRTEIDSGKREANVHALIDALLLWVKDRRKRYEAHAGGLGRRKK